MSRVVCDVVVIGGGIVGMSIAYQLAKRGGGRVVVLEKGAAVAEGSTEASSACLRLRYTHDEVVQLARAGLEIYRRWPEFTGRTGKEDADSAGAAPTPLLESGLEPEPAPVKPTTWAIHRPDEDEREAEALL